MNARAPAASCEHCEAVRSHHGLSSYPDGLYTDPGLCYCPCHDVWRVWKRLIGSAW